jgi:tetratricopeptide (TPR) repeat protein
MKWGFSGAAVAAFGLTLTALAPAALAESPPDALRIKADGAMTALMSGGCERTPAAFEPVVSDRAFKSLEPDTRAALLGGAAVCAASGGDTKAAYRYAKLGTQEPGADGANWAVRLTLALANAEGSDAVTSFSVLANKFPDALGELDDASVAAVYAQVRTDPERLMFVEALRSADWKPQDPLDTGDALRLERVRLLLGAGRSEEAKQEARAVEDPIQLLSLSVDERYAPVRAEASDLRAAAEAALSKASLIAAGAPDRLSGAVTLASLHLQLGRPAVALRVLEAALERRRKNGAAAFVDADTQLPYALDLRAQALFALGRTDEAVAQMSEAASPGGRRVDPSRLVSLVGALTYVGRAQEALAALDAVDATTLDATGQAWVEAARSCALRDAGRAPEAAAAAQSVDRLAPKAWTARTHARLCAGDLEAAAKLYRDRLAEPEGRTAALLALQAYRPKTGTGSSVWGERRQAQLDAIRNRPDVRQAVVRANGRLDTVPLFDIYGRL